VLVPPAEGLYHRELEWRDCGAKMKIVLSNTLEIQ